MAKAVSRELVVNGKPLYAVIDNPEFIDPVLQELLGEGQVFEILDRVAQRPDTDDLSDISETLCGIDGFWVTKLLRAYIGRVVSGNIDHRCKFSGQIYNYDLSLDPADKSMGSGKLVVDVTVDTFKDRTQILNCDPQSKLFRWDIKINKFSIYDRTDDLGDLFENPFPLMKIEHPGFEFPDSALDPDNSTSIWCRCLDRKLYAEGPEGFSIERISCGPDDQNLEDIDCGHCWYDVSENSCVDLMLKSIDGDIPTTLEELFRVDGDYCLGRCASPPVFNTGGH